MKTDINTEHLACMAYQLFQPKPENVLETDEPFAIYSYDRIVRTILRGMMDRMVFLKRRLWKLYNLDKLGGY